MCAYRGRIWRPAGVDGVLGILAPLSAFLAAAGLAGYLRLRGGKGIPWMLGSAVSLALLGYLVWLRWKLPQIYIATEWIPLSTFVDAPMFALDGQAWPYALALSAVIAAIFLTSSARLSTKDNGWPWVGVLVTGGIGLLAVQAANLMTVVLVWTALDIFEAVAMSSRFRTPDGARQAVIAFGTRVTGSLLVIFAAIINRSLGIAPAFGGLPPLPGMMLLLAAGLRLGVLPLNLPAVTDPRLSRGLGTALRLVNAAASLTVLARLPVISFTPETRYLLLALTAVGSLYGAAMWLAAKDELEGRPFWIIALAGMAVFSTIQGRMDAGQAWGCALLLAGAQVFLYSARKKALVTFPLLSMAAFSTLPFTPAAQGWEGIFQPPLHIWQLSLLLVHLLLLLGYLRHILSRGDNLRTMEPWVQSAYPAGLAILFLAQVFLGIYGWPGVLTVGVWWIGVLAGAILVAVGIIWQRNRDLLRRGWAFIVRNGELLRRAGGMLRAIFSLNWLYRLGGAAFELSSRVTQVLVRSLEGDAGFLWILVILAAFLSLLQEMLRS